MIRLQFRDMVGTISMSPTRKSNSKSIINPLYSTGEAFSKAYAISKIDGPLPTADIVGLTYAIFDSGKSWYDYFN